jgi:hypothetical protein
MKSIRRIAAFLFPAKSGEISLLIRALAATIVSGGVVFLWLWFVHTPP